MLAGMHNSLTLAGMLATEVALATDLEGVTVARFRLVVHSRRWDRTGNCWVNSPPTVVTVACSRRLAENAAASLRRGDPVVVAGRLRVQRSARDQRRTQLEIEAWTVGPDLARTTASAVRRVEAA